MIFLVLMLFFLMNSFDSVVPVQPESSNASATKLLWLLNWIWTSTISSLMGFLLTQQYTLCSSNCFAILSSLARISIFSLISVVLSSWIVLFKYTINTSEFSTDGDNIGISRVIDCPLTDPEENPAQPISPCSPFPIVYWWLTLYRSWWTSEALSSHTTSSPFCHNWNTVLHNRPS